MKSLTPQETLRTIADGTKLEWRWYDNLESEDFDPLQNSVSIEKIFRKHYIFRLRQETITVGDASFPKPESSPLKLGTMYYCVDLFNIDLFFIDTWDNLEEDYHRLGVGSIHLTKENAIAHAKAPIKLSRGKVDD